MTDEQIETRLSFIERQMATASPKDLPYLNATYQKLMDRLVSLDMAASAGESSCLSRAMDTEREPV